MSGFNNNKPEFTGTLRYYNPLKPNNEATSISICSMYFTPTNSSSATLLGIRAVNTVSPFNTVNFTNSAPGTWSATAIAGSYFFQVQMSGHFGSLESELVPHIV